MTTTPHQGTGLGNGQIGLGIITSHGARLATLRDLSNDYEFIRDEAAPKTLFRLALVDAERQTTWFDARDAVDVTTVDIPDGLIIRSTFGGMTVTVTVNLTGSLSCWRMRVEGVPAGRAVKEMQCPVISGVMSVGGGVPGEAVATPVQSEGYLFTDPFPVVDNLPLRAGYPECRHAGMGEVHGMYPGGLAMQMMLYYNGQSGLYLAAHDAGMHVKGFHLGQMADWGMFPVMWVSHHPPEIPGDAAFEYDTVVGVFHGDWHAGADIYKAWARRQWWCEKTLGERDIAPWLREGFGVWQMSNFHIPEIKLNHSLDQIAEETNAISRDAGVPLAGLIFNYEKGGAWTGPIGLPPKEGAEACRAAMQKLKAAGNHGFVYIPGGNWYVAIDSYDPPFDSWKEFEERGRAIAIVKEDGEVNLGSWYGGWHSSWLCPHTRGNREVLAEELLSCMRWGIDWVQIDNFPCGGPMACYSTEHGHPPGFGAWITEDWRDTLADVRRRIKAVNPDAVLSTEGICEVFIPYLDIYDQRAGNMEYFGHHNPGHPAGGRLIPIFEYVYGPYLTGYCAAYPDTNRPEVLYWTRSLGKALSLGVIPNGGRYWPEPKQSNPVTLAFYKKAVRATKDAWKYLMFGEMLPPPAIDVPTIEAAYLQFTGECLDHLLEKNRHVVTDFAVQHAAWRAEDGSIGYLFANISQEEICFAVDLSAYTDEERACRVEAVTDDARAVLYDSVTLPVSHVLQMKPLSITMIEVLPG